MPPRSAQISQTGLHVEVRGDLIIVTDSSTQFFAIYAKPSHAQLVLRHPAPTDDELLGRAWQAAEMKARELGWINGPPTEADALGGSFVRC
jgi:hypothetical protein